MLNIQDQWKEARKRMTEGVETLFCFDFGITGERLCGICFIYIFRGGDPVTSMLGITR